MREGTPVLKNNVGSCYINPEYSWLGASPDGVVLILMDYLKSSALIITMTKPLFQQHPRRDFIVG